MPVDWSQRHEAIAAWLSRLPRPVGVMAACDSLAEQVLEACGALGLAVPGEVGVLGCGNDLWRCELRQPALSSVMLPGEAVGMEAGRVLGRLLDGAGPPRRQSVLFSSPGIAARDSTALAESADPHLSAALAIIRSRGHQPLTVSEVAAEVGISRRALEQRFRCWKGCSPLEQIQRHRLQIAMQLLRGSEMRIKDIAEAAGFSSAEYFSAAYRKLTGSSPAAFRRAARAGDAASA